MNKKKALAALLVFTLVFIVVYAMGVIINLHFDIHLWGEYSRALLAIVGLGGGLMFGGAAYENTD